MCRSEVHFRPAHDKATDSYQRLYWHNLSLLMMSTMYSKHVKVKVKQSRKRPGVAQRVPGDAPRLSWHSAHEGGEVVSLTHRLYLPPGMFLVLIFTRDWVDPRAMVRSEGICHWKIPVTLPGIDLGTVRLVAQRLNHYATPGPLETCRELKIENKIHRKELCVTLVIYQESFKRHVRQE